MAICTTAEYKTWRGISASTWDTLIATLISGGQKAVEAFCGRLFDSDTRTEYYNGNGSDKLQVKCYPITAVDQVGIVTSRDTTGSPTVQVLTTGTDYWYNANIGIFYRIDAIQGRVGAAAWSGRAWPNDDGYAGVNWGVSPRWPEGYQNIQVQYDGGYSTCPDDLKLAFFQYLDQLWVNTWAQSLPSGLSSEKIGDYQYVIGDPDANAVALQRGMFRTTAKLTEFFGSWKRGDAL